MFRLFLKEGYKTSPKDFEIFLTQIKGLFSKSFLNTLRYGISELEYTIYCNKDDKLEFYFNISDESKLYMLKSSLETLYLDSEIIECDKQFQYTYCNTIEKYKYSKDYELKDSNHLLTRYILNSLKKYTYLTVNLYIDKDDAYHVKLRVATESFDLKNDLKNICSTIQQVTANDSSSTGRNIKLHVKYNNNKPERFEIDVGQLTNFMFIPYDMEKIEVSDKFQVYLSDEDLNDGITIGYSTHPLQKDREIRISIETLRKHFFCTGQPGSGKSATLEMILKSLIEEREKGTQIGFTLFDPKANACVGVVNAIEKLISDGIINDREQFYKKVRYIDLNHDDCGFSINLLDKSVDTTELIGFFREIFNSSGVRLERLIDASIGALQYDTEEHYIEDVLKMFEDVKYSMNVVSRIRKNPEAEMYAKEFLQADFKPEVIDPIKNRIAPFVNNPKKRKIFNSGNDLDNIMQWMEDGYIIMFNTENFSQIEVKMILGYIELRYHLTAVKRRNNALPHLLIIDENSDVQIDIQDRIIAKDRSKGLSNGSFTQYLEQMNKKLSDAFTGAVTTKIILQQGIASSSKASDVVSSNDIVISRKTLESMKTMTAYVSSENKQGEKISLFVKIPPPYRYDSNGTIMEYSDNNKVLQDNLFRREEELQEILNSLMRRDYPVKSKTNIISEKSKSETLLKNTNVFD